METGRDTPSSDPPNRLAAERRRGRGAATNPPVRYERHHREAVDDGWGREEDLPTLRTEVSVDASRSILTRNRSPDVPFDRSVNPYRGCEHGCVYCFARPSHAYLGLSPGLDFETRLVVKPRAAELLDARLRRPGYTVRPIAIGTNTDPYQPIEREHRVMRRVLEVLRDFRHPVGITTKGAALSDDLHILGPMGEDGLAHVAVSITTLDHRLSRLMEPRAAGPRRRLALVRALAERKVPVQVNVAPVVPGINDHEIEAILAAAAEAGAGRASYTVLRLPLEVAGLFRGWLAEHFPHRAGRVMRKVRELHGGRDYDPEWGRRLKGEGVQAELIRRRFGLAAARHGLDGPSWSLRCDLFRVPPRHGDQLPLDL